MLAAAGGSFYGGSIPRTRRRVALSLSEADCTNLPVFPGVVKMTSEGWLVGTPLHKGRSVRYSCSQTRDAWTAEPVRLEARGQPTMTDSHRKPRGRAAVIGSLGRGGSETGSGCRFQKLAAQASPEF